MALNYRPRHGRGTSRRVRPDRASRAAAVDAVDSVWADEPADAPVPFYKNKRTMALIAVLVILAVIVAYGLYVYFSAASNMAAPEQDRAAIQEALDAPVAKDEPSYMLLLGNDRRPGQGWARSDTVILARLDPNEKSVSLISLARDTRVAVPGHGTTKLAHASAYGGPALAIQTVKELTDLPVNHYVQVDFEGFASIVDAVGGVKMTVDKATTSPEGVYVPAGKRVLTGKQALAFVRNRKGYAKGDHQRMKNQQKFLLALARQASKPENFTRLPKIIDSTSENIQTDMSVTELMALAGKYRGIEKEDMRSKSAPVKGAVIGGGSYQVLKEAEFRAMLEDFEDGGFELEAKEDETESSK